MSKSSINLVYWDSQPNFGDCLSPWLIHRLTGKSIRHKSHYAGLWVSIKTLIYDVLHFRWSLIGDILWPWEDNIAAIGSVVKYGNKRTIIWGSGYMSATEKGCLQSKVCASLLNNTVIFRSHPPIMSSTWTVVSRYIHLPILMLQESQKIVIAGIWLLAHGERKGAKKWRLHSCI